MVVPGSVLGLRGAASPNSKLNLAGIGFGGQGAHDLSQMESENIVALCDVDKNHAGRGSQRRSECGRRGVLSKTAAALIH